MDVIRIVSRVFASIGLLFLAVGAFTAWRAFTFTDSSAKAAGTVVELRLSRSGSSSSGHAPVVRFTTNEGRTVEFVSSVSSKPPAYKIGEEVEVLYDPKDPWHAEIDSFVSLWLLPSILFLPGGVFFMIGSVMIYLRKKKDEMIAWLKKRGTQISADIQGVAENTSISVNGRHPFRIIAQCMDTSGRGIHIFKSDNIWYDPKNYLAEHGMTKINVLVDPKNYRRHFMDISFLPKKV